MTTLVFLAYYAIMLICLTCYTIMLVCLACYTIMLICLMCYMIMLVFYLIYELLSHVTSVFRFHQYQEDEIPEALFTYDLSPMAVLITKKGKKWYEFVTSMCALIGGTFTVVGLLSSFLNMIFKSKKI